MARRYNPTDDSYNDIEFPKFLATMQDQQGKVICITGCTTGTGLTAARACAIKGATVVMLNRKSPRVDEAMQIIKAETPAAKLISIDCDLNSFASVRKAALAVTEGFPAGVDVLCCNAGIAAKDEEATEDGFEVQMQVNHLSHFLLVKELLPLLERAAQGKGDARVVSMSSAIRCGFPFQTSKAAGHFYRKVGAGGSTGGNKAGIGMRGGPWDRYHQSKLANMLFTSALDDKLRAAGSKVKALVAAPGLAYTPIYHGHTDKFGGNMMMNFMKKQMMQSSADGAVPILTCMVNPSALSGQHYEPANGSMMLMMKINGCAKLAGWESICKSPAGKELLWTESEAAIGRFDIASPLQRQTPSLQAGSNPLSQAMPQGFQAQGFQTQQQQPPPHSTVVASGMTVTGNSVGSSAPGSTYGYPSYSVAVMPTPAVRA